MRSRFFVVLGIALLFALPALAQVSSTASVDLVAPSTPAVRPREHGPRRAIGLGPDRVIGDVTVAESNNWSGYAVTGSLFTQAKGSWIVPVVDCTAVPNSSASFWVGIDGWVTDTVEQTGTDSDCDGERATYYAWYEFAPRGGVTILSVPVWPGDQMSAEIDYDDPYFTVTITNETTGKSFTTRSTVAGARRESAEWIAELNSYHLSDFGTVSFGVDFTDVSGTNYAVDSSTTGQISDFGKHVWQSIMAAGEGLREAVPSSLSADGSSFTVTWKSD
jgi:hypothetical protein